MVPRSGLLIVLLFSNLACTYRNVRFHDNFVNYPSAEELRLKSDDEILYMANDVLLERQRHNPKNPWQGVPWGLVFAPSFVVLAPVSALLAAPLYPIDLLGRALGRSDPNYSTVKFFFGLAYGFADGLGRVLSWPLKFGHHWSMDAKLERIIVELQRRGFRPDPERAGRDP